MDTAITRRSKRPGATPHALRGKGLSILSKWQALGRTRHAGVRQAAAMFPTDGRAPAAAAGRPRPDRLFARLTVAGTIPHPPQESGMAERETSIERSGGTEAERRQDGGGRTDALPGSEASRGNVEPEVDAPKGAEEIWTPASGTRKTDPAAEAQDASST